MGFFEFPEYREFVVRKGAIISPCKRYRYLLTRTWDARAATRPLVFCGLNPSTADADKDDATIRWLIGYARKHSFGGLIVVNLFAWRATLPKDMLVAKHPVQEKGTENNDLAIQQVLCTRGAVFLCGWGSNGTYLCRDQTVMNILRRRAVTPYCLKVNADGTPHHPLRISHDTELKEYTL